MAVDTIDKRSSAIHLTLPWRNQLPTPSGSINGSQRAQVALMYSGFWSATPPAPGTGNVPSRPMIVHAGCLIGWP